MSTKPTLLRLETDDQALVYVNGRLIALVHAHDLVSDRDALWAQVQHANCLKALPNILTNVLDHLGRSGDLADHIARTPAKKTQDFARGLLDGSATRTVPWPGGDPLMPPVPPEGTKAYLSGYQCGEALARVCRLAEFYKGKAEEEAHP